MLVIPAVDIRKGRCVRLMQGRPEDEVVYGEDPVAMARRWAAEGAGRIHVVDLDGALTGEMTNREAIEAIIREVQVPVAVGGGIRTTEIAEGLIAVGAARVVIGTAALEDRAAFEKLVRANPGRVSLGLDAREGWAVIRGWTEQGGAEVIELLREFAALPLAEIIHTDVLRDGMLVGPNFSSIERVARKSRHPVIVAGGVSTVEDVRRLARMKLSGCIIGQALYAGSLTLAAAQAAAGEAGGKGS